MEYEYEQTGQSGTEGPPRPAAPKRQNDLAMASLILGIAGIVTSCCCCMGIVVSSLALTLGLLSRTDERLDQNAKLGVIAGGIGLALSLIMTVGWVLLMDNADSLFGMGNHLLRMFG